MQQVHRGADHRHIERLERNQKSLRWSGFPRQEAGVPVADLCRKHGVNNASLYNWKAKYGGMNVSEAKKLKALEDKNARLKKPLADSMLDKAALKNLLRKSW